MYLLLFILVMVASGAVSWKFKSRFKQYSKAPLQEGLSGKEVAELMLHQNGIYDVEVVSVNGSLTDHYNPMTKKVNLSPQVYNGRSVASTAVAAHECGHAVQHAKAYAWLGLRSALVPVVSITNNAIPMLLLGGILVLYFFQIPWVLLAGIVLFAFTTLFTFVTLPVEFDASRRALAWLSTANITTQSEYGKAKNALKWAAMTYVVAALSSLATLLYYVMIFMGGRR